MAWQPLIVVLGRFAVAMLAWQGFTDRQRWFVEFPIGVVVWGSLLVAAWWFVMLSFVAKCVVIWGQVRRATSLEWQIVDSHPDPFGNLSSFASLWHRFYVIAIYVGSFVISYAAMNDAWWNPAVMIGMVLYILIVPFLFVRPLWVIHQKMRYQKEVAVENYYGQLEKCRPSAIMGHVRGVENPRV